MSIVKKIRVVALLAIAMVAVSYASTAEAGRFCDRFRGRGGDCCEPTCCEPAPCCEPATCCEDPCDRGGLFSRFRNKHRGNNCCEPTCCEPAPCAAPCPAPCEPAPCCKPAPCCDPCDPCCGEKDGFFGKLRGKFKNRGGNGCCDPCAPSCGC